MSSDGKAVLERLTKIAAAGTALTSMTAGVLSVYREVRGATVPLIEELKHLPSAARWAVIALLFLVPIYLFVQQRRRRGKPAPAPGGPGPRSLIGRDRDLKNLRKACINDRLVFVVGDSGVGKSTLIDNLSFEGADLSGPIVVRHWGDHWLQGPARIMASAIAKLLENGDGNPGAPAAGDGSSGALASAAAPSAASAPAMAAPAAPGLPADPEHPAGAAVPGVPSNLPWSEQIRALFEQRNRQLLIVFDGFDDYSVRFHDQLFQESESRFLRPAELREANAFWAEVAKLLDDGVIHCVFVTRSDAQSALAPVRFVEPEVLHISRLPRSTAENLLDEIFAAPQDDPDWEPLRDQLLDDLDDGGVLPAQAIAAERALRLLPRRTLRDYRAQGGLVGLELAQLEELVIRASLTAVMTPTTARLLLQLMVDESSTPPKARPLSLSDTDPSAAPPGAGTVQGVSVGRDAARKLMVELAREDVVRPSASQPDTWTLYHDYVARVIAAMNKRADRWTTLLSEAHKAARSARGLVARYRALLTPTTQIVLAAQRLFSIGIHRGFRYSGHRRFAAASLLRFLPWVALTGAGSYWWVMARATDSGRQLFAQLSARASTPSGSEVDALWRLKQSTSRVQDAFLAHALALPETAATFSRRAPYLVHAIVGLDRKRRADVLAVVRKRCVERPEPDLRLAGACLHAGLVLEDDSEAFWQFAMTSLLRKLRESLEEDNDPELNLESWVTWLVRAPTPRELRETAQATLFAGLQELLALPALARPRERGRDSQAHSLSRIFQRFRLRVPETLVVPLVKQLTLAQRLPTLERLELAWRIAAVQPGKEVAAHIATLLLQMSWQPGVPYLGGLRPIDQTEAPYPPKEVNDALYRALIAHASTLRSEDGLQLLDTLEAMPALSIAIAESPLVKQELATARRKINPVNEPAQGASTGPEHEDDDNPLEELSRAVERARPELIKLARGSFADEIKRANEGWDELRALIRPRDPRPFIERFWALTQPSPVLCVLAVALLADNDDLEDKDSPVRKMLEGHAWDNTDEKQTWFQACLKSYAAADPESVNIQGSGSKDPAAKIEDIVKDILEGRRDPFKDAFDARAVTGKIDSKSARALLAHFLSTLDNHPDRQEAAAHFTIWTIEHANDAPRVAKHLIDLTRDVDKFAWNRLLVRVLADKELGDKVLKGPSEVLSELHDVLIRMITVMQSSPQGASLSPFVATLCATPNIDRAPVFEHLTSTLLSTLDVPRFEALRPCLPGLRGLPAKQDVPGTLLQLLEWPTCVGACRTDLIRFLNQEEPGSGKTFWSVEEWARMQGLPRTALVKPRGT